MSNICGRFPSGLSVILMLGLLFAGASASVYSQTADDFNPGAGGGYAYPSVCSLAVQADGKVLVGGMFTTLGGQPRAHIGRLNADGSLDTTFNPGADGQVNCVALQADGRILVGGMFTTLSSQSRTNIGRLNADGSLDTIFNPGADGSWVGSLTVQADGRILVGGWFTSLCGQSHSNIGRLNADGSLDATFNPGVDGSASAIAVQVDGKILVGGYFITMGGQSRANIGRLNADGSLDTTFDPGADIFVNCIAVQADGKILVGGGFDTMGGQSRATVGRLNADGSLDTSFNPGADVNVTSIAVQADGKILVGGQFAILGGQTRNCIGRLNNTESATQSLTFDGSTITWLRGGASPEVWRTSFDVCTNGADWISVGSGQRIDGGWQLTGLDYPAQVNIRARGFLTGDSSRSSWFVESFAGSPMIVVNDGGFGMFSNAFCFTVRAASGQTVAIESSTNLLNWLPLRTNTFNTGTFYYFSDTNAPDLSQRFYRAKLMP